jgi:hypothetical protein
MTDDPQRERIARLLAELEELPFDEREAFIAALSEEDREAVWAAEVDQSEEVFPDDYEDLGAGE